MNHNLMVGQVRYAEELAQAWEQMGYGSPASVADWMKEIDAGKNSILVGWVGNIATGQITIKWTGPSERHQPFTEALATEFPRIKRFPTFYALFINEESRGNGFGQQLTRAAEGIVLENKRAVNKAALDVEVTNEPANHIYEKAGYKKIRFRGEEAVILDTPGNYARREKGEPEVPSYIMTKDLTQA